MRYIEIRCPNVPRERECNHTLGGVEVKSLPRERVFREVRYCASCNLFWEITVEGDNIDLKAVTDRLNLIPATEAYLVTVEGVKKK